MIAGVQVRVQRRHTGVHGFLHKVLLRSELLPGQGFGEVYAVGAEPGGMRGNHLHRRMGEWFAVVSGEGVVVVVDPATGERLEVPSGESTPCTVFVPAGLAHALVNRGAAPMVAVAWAEGEHDPDDVVPYAVAGPTTDPAAPGEGLRTC